jgi:8-oxo-dGTP pyrophosphatase MutT (NUDIX family)
MTENTDEDLLVLKAHVKGHMRGQHYVRPYDRQGGSAHPEPHHHPELDHNGKPVLVKQPSHPSAPSTWDNPEAVATFVPGGHVPLELNGIPVRRWKDHPNTAEGWDFVRGINDDLDEPPLVPKPGKTIGAGIVVEEKDGRVWVVHPTNQFGGYRATMPKGTAEAGISLQGNALKECFEEAGLEVEITGFLGDFDRSTSVARYYRGRRLSGDPTSMGWESQAVSLVPKDRLYEVLNGRPDHPIAEAVGAGPAPKISDSGANMGQKPMFGGLFGKK